VEAGIKESHVPRIYRYLVKNPQTEWSSIPDLPKAAWHVLDRDFVRFTSTVEQCQTSTDGTKKLLIRLQDGLKVEAVIMVYCQTAQPREGEDTDAEEVGRSRSTLCVSSQVGCQMGCTFCATGTMGLIADLTAGEILEQAVHALQLSPFRNVVFMGMGEPLNNYAAVKAAVSMLTDNRSFSLQRQKVTVSTVGVIPKVLQLSEDLPGVSLAFSLHAPTQELRQTIVPSASAYPLPKLMQAFDTFLDKQEHRNPKIFVEYVMLAKVNDNPEQAHQLGRLLSHRPHQYMVNLIPWNPVYSPDISFEAPGPERLDEFHRVVRSHNIICTVRKEMGQEIEGACGQLVVQSGQQGRGGAKVRAGCSRDSKDIEEIGRESAAPALGKAPRSIWNLFGTVA